MSVGNAGGNASVNQTQQPYPSVFKPEAKFNARVHAGQSERPSGKPSQDVKNSVFSEASSTEPKVSQADIDAAKEEFVSKDNKQKEIETKFQNEVDELKSDRLKNLANKNFVFDNRGDLLRFEYFKSDPGALLKDPDYQAFSEKHGDLSSQIESAEKKIEIFRKRGRETSSLEAKLQNLTNEKTNLESQNKFFASKAVQEVAKQDSDYVDFFNVSKGSRDQELEQFGCNNTHLQILVDSINAQEAELAAFEASQNNRPGSDAQTIQSIDEEISSHQTVLDLLNHDLSELNEKHPNGAEDQKKELIEHIKISEDIIDRLIGVSEQIKAPASPFSQPVGASSVLDKVADEELKKVDKLNEELQGYNQIFPDGNHPLINEVLQHIKLSEQILNVLYDNLRR